MAPRQDLISSAVTFLRDPSVASAPIEKRIEFLQSKNLTKEEVDLALSQAATEGTSNQALPPSQPAQPYYPPPGQYPSQQYNQNLYPQYGQYPPPPPPEPPRRDWRDYFILATVAGGASLGLYTLIKRYVAPIIAPPTPPQIEQDKAYIDEQFNRAFTLIETLSEDTTKLKDAEEQRTKRLDTAINDIELIVTEMKTANQRREDDARRMEAEVRGMKDSLPVSINQVRDASERQLKELGAELASLKALMSNRLGGGTSSGSLPMIPKAPRADVNSYINGSTRHSNAGTPTTESPAKLSSAMNGAMPHANYQISNSNSPSVQAQTQPSNPMQNAISGAQTSRAGNTTNLGYGGSNVSIPAWQQAAQKKSDAAATNGAGAQSSSGASTDAPRDGAGAVAALQAS